jgi:ligand-binding sensor protein
MLGVPPRDFSSWRWSFDRNKVGFAFIYLCNATETDFAVGNVAISFVSPLLIRGKVLSANSED